MMNTANFEKIYEKYSPMLFGLALEICPSKKHAEELLLITFKKIHQDDINRENHPAYCITLIRLIIKTAHGIYPEKFQTCLSLKQFETTPLLNQLICDQKSLEDYCKEKPLSQQEALQIMRDEFSKIRNSKQKNEL